MKRLLFTILFACTAGVIAAQTTRQEIISNPRLAYNTYLAYPTPDKKLTAAPEGYQPFYISHYGRHGSRWLGAESQYETPRQLLHMADSAGVLTQLGKNVLQRMDTLCLLAKGRYGELTRLGAEQHRQIASRMFHNFPEVFEGNADIDARSTIVRRCILSMANECIVFQGLNPQLNITCESTQCDMPYLNFEAISNSFNKHADNKDLAKALNEFEKKHLNPQRFISSLFTEADFVNKCKIQNHSSQNSTKLYQTMFGIAGDMQSIDSRMSFFDLFTDDELYELWNVNNAEWYSYYGATPYNGQMMQYLEANLLRNILETADSVINSGKHGATLRFGHDSVIVPLSVLMELNNCAYSTKNFETLAANWTTYKISPMGANIQIIFYRNNANDILIKVLLNEAECTLPVKSEIAPYYHWNDVDKYYREKLAKFEKAN